ncbi:hypothetical protein FRC18_012190 [Serendipita sp. 400]|nr:hypothetical protein FRC18_012190 [Serendipita sp. 400]
MVTVPSGKVVFSYGGITPSLLVVKVVAPASFISWLPKCVRPHQVAQASSPVHIRTVMDIQDAGQLKRERQKILQELHEMGLQGPVSSALQTRYNQIIDHQSEPSFPDPLRVLPPETCTQIFWEIIREEHPGNQLESLLLLSSVSVRIRI